MGIDNVKLWFAKNECDEIVTIDDLKGSNTYLCPVCGSDLIPKATESKRITPHFAHVDKSKCNNESMMHFWFKHKFLEQGDKFKVVTDKEIEYVCKDVLVEQQYTVGDKIYRPDVTIITECDKTIYFEMNYSNKKEVKDYIDIWLELKNIVVEIDIKQLMSKSTLPSFKALFYEGKCFNTKRNDTYYNTIGKYKEELHKGKITKSVKERICKLNWFWNDLIKFKKNDVSIEHMFDLISSINKKDKPLIMKILRKSICNDLYVEYTKYVKKQEEMSRKMALYNFVQPIKKDHFLYEVVEKLNTYYKNIDRKYDVILEQDYSYLTAERKFRGKHVGFKKVPAFCYYIKLAHCLSDSYLKTENVNRLVMEMNNLDKAFDYYKSLLNEHEIVVNCFDCKNEFKLTADEINFFRSKDFHLPKRCKYCRKSRKQIKRRD